MDLKEELSKAKSKKRRREYEQLVLDAEDELYALIITADFSKRQIGIISRRIQEAWILIARSEKEIELVARDARLPVKDLRRSIRQVRRNFDGSGQEVIMRTGIGEERWRDFDSRASRASKNTQDRESHWHDQRSHLLGRE